MTANFEPKVATQPMTKVRKIKATDLYELPGDQADISEYYLMEVD